LIGAIIIVGIAGSGKTELCASLAQWFKSEGQRVAVLNLDPGVLKIPYEPDVDVREYVDSTELMNKYGLGPNGSLLLAMDLIANNIERINEELMKLKPNYLIVDTPGQMEIFAYRTSGLFLADQLYADSKVILFLFDGVFCKDPKNFVSNALLSASIYFRFSLPIINVLTKIDLLRKAELRKEIIWSKKPQILLEALHKRVEDEEAMFIHKIAEILYDHFEKTHFIPVSSVTLSNFSTLIAAITRILFSGEEKLSY